MDNLPTMSVAIMTHPDRLDMAKELQKHIGGGEILGVEETSAWACCRVCYEAHDPNADYHMVIQDDVGCQSSVIEDSRYLLQTLSEPAIVSLQDNHPIDGYRWRIASGLNNSRCMILPTSMINNWLNWDAENVLPDLRPDDIHMTLFAKTHRIPVYFPNPSLVYQKDVWSVFNEMPALDREYKHIGDSSVHDFDWENCSIKRDMQKQKTQGFGLLHEWALSKIDLVYMPDAKFTKKWFLGRKNIRPYSGVEISKRGVSTGKTAISLPPFDDVTIPEKVFLSKGKYRARGKITFSHLMEKNTYDDLPEGILDRKDKLVKVSGAGSIRFILSSETQVIYDVAVGIFYNTRESYIRLDFELHEDTELSIDILSSVWGNMAVKFFINFNQLRQRS